MKRPFKKWIILGALFLISPGLSLAEDVDLEKIVVSASRIEEPVGATASSVTVISDKTMQSKGIFAVKDALREANGLDVASSGGPGSTTSVFLRGASAGQTRVMLDGVKIYDPTSTDASYDFAHLNTNNIERIEILKGSQSSLYGSDAMGGVINIITRKGLGKPKILLLSEGGSFYTSREMLEISGQSDKLHFSFGSSRLDSKGFSKAKEKNNNPEDDAYQNSAFSLRLDYDIIPDLTLGLINRYTHTRTELDDYDYTNDRPSDDSDRLLTNDEGLSSLFLEQKISDFYKHKLQLSFTRNYRRGRDDTDEYEREWYDGKTYQLDWQSVLDFSGVDKVITGFNYLREKADTYYYSSGWESDFPKSTSNIKGVFIENKLNPFDNLFFNATYRIDDHSEFKDYDTYKVELSYLWDKIDTRIRTLYGTGFKSPSLYQLSSPPTAWGPIGNPNLIPEESQSYEIGFEQGFFKRKFLADITYFHTHFKNLIDFASGTGYINLSKARTSGIETSLKVKKDNLTSKLGYTLLDTENKENGDELLKRAKNKANLEFNWNLVKWDLNFWLGYVGHRSDYKNKLLKSYTLANLSLNYKINKNLTTFGRIENLFNEKYEETKNYQTAPFSIYGGMKAEF